MKGLDFTEKQRQRLEQVEHRLGDVIGALHRSVFVSIGDVIDVDHEAGFLRGHGTQLVDGQLLATVCGVVERVNKLVSVRSLKTRYSPEIGDVVVGRVTKIAQKRWRVDVYSRQHASLMLSAVNLPGGVQRRRTEVDEQNMSSIYAEGDVISAEVQSFFQDGSINLHTRSLKYGKLENGQLVTVPPYVIKRIKQHFQSLEECGVDVILGCNGYVWVSAPAGRPVLEGLAGVMKQTAQTGVVEPLEQGGGADGQAAVRKRENVLLQVRECICRVANAILVLGFLGLPIHPHSITDTFLISRTWGIEIKDMLSPDFILRLAEREADRREQEGVGGASNMMM